MARNSLLAAPPYPVETALKHLGESLRTARIRRSLTIQEVAQKIGTGVRAVSDAEKGKASTGIAIYASLLWVYSLLNDFEKVADPSLDTIGQALALSKEGERVRHKNKDFSNDF